MQNGQSTKAVAEYRKAVEYYKTDPEYTPFYNAVVRENSINAIGYTLLQSKHYPEAIQVFELATETYPNSANGWESLSEAYETARVMDKAKTAAQKALEVIGKDDTMNADFKARVRQGAEERLKRL